MRVPRGRPSMRDLYMRTTSDAARLMKRSTASSRLMMSRHSVKKWPEPVSAQARRCPAGSIALAAIGPAPCPLGCKYRLAGARAPALNRHPDALRLREDVELLDDDARRGDAALDEAEI